MKITRSWVLWQSNCHAVSVKVRLFDYLKGRVIMTFKEKHNAVVGENTVQALNSRGMEAYYYNTRAEAVEKILSLIPEGSSVTWGGTQTITELGIDSVLKSGKYEVFDREAAEEPEEKRAIELRAFDADYFLMSANAISQDGVLVNIDGNGNRVAALCYGPRNVIVAAGINKVAPTEEDALKRAKNIAAPTNAIKRGGDYPCITTGRCEDCRLETCICRNIVIIRMCRDKRIKVVLFGEEAGF